MIFTQKLSPVTWSYTIYGLTNKLNLVADPSLLTLIQSYTISYSNQVLFFLFNIYKYSPVSKDSTNFYYSPNKASTIIHLLKVNFFHLNNVILGGDDGSICIHLYINYKDKSIAK